jgi:hypothetical protein
VIVFDINVSSVANNLWATEETLMSNTISYIILICVLTEFTKVENLLVSNYRPYTLPGFMVQCLASGTLLERIPLLDDMEPELEDCIF